jgi:hypothetical protein
MQLSSETCRRAMDGEPMALMFLVTSVFDGSYSIDHTSPWGRELGYLKNTWKSGDDARVVKMICWLVFQSVVNPHPSQ